MVLEKVAILICTYNRNEKLKNTLKSIKELDYDLNKITIVIVDNDKNELAKDVVQAFKDKLNIIYQKEEKRGISYARNKCLEIVRNVDCDYVAFIDDDEYVCKEWLNEFVKGIKKLDADIVRGPVERVWKFNIPKWYEKSNENPFSDIKDGERLEKCFTGNALLKKEVIKEINFDEKYALSGGEDTKFFMQLNQKGYVMKFCKPAVVYEEVSKERVSIKYIVKRAFRDSANYVIIEKEVLKTPFFIRLSKSIVKLLINLVVFPIRVIQGYKGIITLIKGIARSSGEIYGLLTLNTIRGY